MKKKVWQVAGLVVLTGMLLMLATACGAKKYEAQAINEEIDKCVICNMSVKDDPYATQIITVDGQSLKFDDIGCMNEWRVKNGVDTIGAEFVRDHNTGDWLKYEKAYYAYDPSYTTPMAYGVIAFVDQASAQAYIDEQKTGVLLSAEDLSNHSWEVNRDMMDMTNMEMHEEQMHSDDSSEGMNSTHSSDTTES